MNVRTQGLVLDGDVRCTVAIEEPDFKPGWFGLHEEPDLMLTLLDEESTRALGEALFLVLGAGSFLGLVGNLGAGKTTLMQGMSVAAGATDVASSPTYTLVNVYEGGKCPLVHMDLYRLSTPDDLESIGYWDYASLADVLLCVEWLNIIPEAWPGQGVLVQLWHDGSGRTANIWVALPQGVDLLKELRSMLEHVVTHTDGTL